MPSQKEQTEPDYKGFAIAILGGWPEPYGEALDGFELQELGVKYGMLRKETRTTPCCDSCSCAEYHGSDEEVTCYVRNWPSAVPYRTPACDKHLDRNDDPDCPWCKLAEANRHIEELQRGKNEALDELNATLRKLDAVEKAGFSVSAELERAEAKIRRLEDKIKALSVSDEHAISTVTARR